MKPVKGVTFLCWFAFFFLFFSIIPAGAQAEASLYFSPAQGTYGVGKKFAVNVYASSPDEAANAFSGRISFPADKLQVTSLSKEGSKISLWVQEPSASQSNGAGVIQFEGIILNPGYTGPGAKILTINFKVKARGTAELTFESGSILANDGEGTNILSGLGTAVFTLGAASDQEAAPVLAQPIAPAAAPKPVPAAPEISSPTHGDDTKWYANNNPVFKWSLPPDVIGVSIAFDQQATTTPAVRSSGKFTSKKYKKIRDGVWYFHLRLRNKNGWGPSAHFKVQIDTVSPALPTIRFPHGAQSTDSRPVVLFDTTDAASGIAYYEVTVDELNSSRVALAEAVESNPYTIPPQEFGSHIITVKATDWAENVASATASFSIVPLATPLLTNAPRTLAEGQLLKIDGQTYPNANLDVFLQGDSDKTIANQSVRSNNFGYFDLIWPSLLPAGRYTYWAVVSNDKDAYSLKTDPINLTVNPWSLSTWSKRVMNYAIPLMLIIILCFAVLFTFWYGWHRFQLFRRRLRLAVAHTEEDLERAIAALRTSLQRHIDALEYAQSERKLTKEEVALLIQLRNDLELIDGFIKKDMEELEEKVRGSEKG